MKTKFFALILSVMLMMPFMLYAQEVEIQLMEVIQMNPIPGDNPLDDPEQTQSDPPRPRDFRALVNGNSLSVQKLESAIPSAQATVVNASTGGVVVNQQFTNSLEAQIANPGVYVLHITTEGGALVGQFVVQ